MEFPSGFYEGDVLPFEKVRGTAKVATVGAAESPGNVRNLRLQWKGIDPRRLDRCVWVAYRLVRLLSQESSHENDALFAADEFTPGAQCIIGQHGSIASEDDS
jgi:hypothetical protein